MISVNVTVTGVRPGQTYDCSLEIGLTTICERNRKVRAITYTYTEGKGGDGEGGIYVSNSLVGCKKIASRTCILLKTCIYSASPLLN